MALCSLDRLSLRAKATLVVLLILILALISLAAAGIVQMRRLLAAEESRTVQAVARGIGRASELALAVRDDRELARIAERFMCDDQILLIAIYDTRGRLAAHSSRTPDLWERYLQGRTAQDNLLLGDQPVELMKGADEFAADDIARPPVSAPGHPSVPPEGKIGRVVVGLSTAPAIQAQRQQTRLTIVGTLLAGGLSSVLVFITVGFLTRRLNRLVWASERIARGDLDHPIDERRQDEIGRLSSAYEQMRLAVQQRDAELHRFNDTLQQQVQERTRSLTEALESAQAADRAKSRFLATMSHEIRTPLNGIVGMVDLLRGTELNDNQTRYAQIARSSADALLSVINDILDFSKIDAGRMELEAVDFDLLGTVEDLVETSALATARKGLELTCIVQPDVPTRAVGDSGRLRQILCNLINNAIKFTEHGQIVVRAALVQQDAAGLVLRFSVADSGIGVPEDRRHRLFQSFSQVDVSTTRKYGGTGLGLAISKRLAELMGGAIGVDSQPGVGSTFWFTVRLLASVTPNQAPASRPRLLGDLRKLRVLAVDDSAVNREVLQQQLSTWKLDVQAAADGPAALALLEASARHGRPFHLAILDWHMPDMDGLQLAQAIRAAPALRDLPLIMLTSIEDQIQDTELRALGFAAYLIKPVRQSRLFDAIAQAMGTAWNPAAGAAPPAAATAAAPVVAPAKLHVLLAEDNQINQMVASEILTKSGFTCEIVDNGRRACAAVALKTYDVVLMDCQMPEMDGLEAARAIRQREAGTGAHVPIIALTANAIKGDREACLAAGMDDYVSKPINPADLLKAIKTVTQNLPLRPPEASAAPHGNPSSPRPTASGTPTAPNPAPETSAPPLDLREFQDRCMDNVEFARKILTKFEALVGDDLHALAQAIGHQEFAVATRLAHSLKGSAANLSATGVRNLAAELEELSRNRNPQSAREAIARLEVEVARCLRYIPTALAILGMPPQEARGATGPAPTDKTV